MRKFMGILVLLLVIVTGVSLWLTKGGKPAGEVLQTAEGEGEAAIGGSFTLTDDNGKTVHDSDYRGKIMVVFFGYTHCPDICPMTTTMLSGALDKLGDKANNVAPIYVSVDPRRDTPAVLKDYLANFNHRIIGLTGNEEQIKEVTSAYKAYFAKMDVPWADEGDDDSKGGDAKDADASKDQETDEAAEGKDTNVEKEQADINEHGQTDAPAAPQETAKEGDAGDDDDYDIDHSTFIYIMDTQGKYVTHLPYTATDAQLAAAIEAVKQ